MVWFPFHTLASSRNYVKLSMKCLYAHGCRRICQSKLHSTRIEDTFTNADKLNEMLVRAFSLFHLLACVRFFCKFIYIRGFVFHIFELLKRISNSIIKLFSTDCFNKKKIVQKFVFALFFIHWSAFERTVAN